MKKALISSLKVQLPGQQVLSSQQVDTTKNPRFWYAQSQMSQDQHSQNQYFWTVMEEGIEGKCENTYQVSELPEYMIHDYEKGMFNTALCHGKKYFQILRTKDFSKCVERNLFLSSKGHKNCLVGKCESENTKQTQTRFYACADSVTEIPYWHGVINEGEMKQSVLAFNTEPVVTGTKQVIKLEKIQKITNKMPEVPSPKECNDLTYEFPVTKSQSVEKLSLVAQQLHSTELIAEKEVPSQLKALKTIISVLKTSELKQIFESIKSLSVTQEIKQTIRTLFIDLVRNSGSSPSVMFILDALKNEQLTEMENYYTIVTL